ncbi:MAG TPA: hypothetical protein VGI96_01265 [Streptosporangiaceae bacterium]|jgi:hypothetical protein
MTGPARPAPEPAAETWTYGGIRAGKNGKKGHAWLDAAGEDHWFARTDGGRMAIGSRYGVRVTRRDDGGITVHGTPEYAGTAADEATRQALWAEHAVAQAQIETVRAERDAARRNALDEALAPLLALASTLRTGAQRDALPPTSSASSTTAGNPGSPPGNAASPAGRPGSRPRAGPVARRGLISRPGGVPARGSGAVAGNGRHALTLAASRAPIVVNRAPVTRRRHPATRRARGGRITMAGPAIPHRRRMT